MKCRHCGKETNIPKIQIRIELASSTSYFRYPDTSRKTDDDGMKMLLKYLDELKQGNKPYQIFVEVLEDENV